MMRAAFPERRVTADQVASLVTESYRSVTCAGQQNCYLCHQLTLRTCENTCVLDNMTGAGEGQKLCFL